MNNRLDILKAANPTLELQFDLIDIAENNPEIPMVTPTGIYDQQTQNAVREFQKVFNLPITGKIDYETWNAIIKEHSMAIHNIKPAGSVFCFPQNLKECKKGDSCNIVYILQILLNNLNSKYKNYPKLEVTGIFDEQTEASVKQFQKSSNLPVTGKLDRQTWNILNKINQTCKLYED